MTPEQLIETTKDLIRLPTTQDNPKALKQAIDIILGIIISKHLDITIERFEQKGRPSILTYLGKQRPKKFGVLLNAHLDVVPANPEQFKPYEKNGRLYGRGALDMKGTATVMTSVFCEKVNEVDYPLGLQIVTDEELGGYDGAKFQIDNNVRADLVLVGEYSNARNTIYNAARGICWTEIAFKGKSAHGGHLWKGQNAVVQAGNFAGAVLKRYPTPDKETWVTTASIANLYTPNDAFNRVPDKAVLKIDFRFTKEDPTFYNQETIKAFIASIDPSAELIGLPTFEPAVHFSESNSYVQGLSRAVQEVTKKEVHFGNRPAGSDGRHFALVDSAVIEFGLCGQGSHSDVEYVEIDSFMEYRDILRNFLDNPTPKSDTQDNEPLHEGLLRKLFVAQTLVGAPAASYNSLGYIQEFLESRGMHVERIEQNRFRSIVATSRPNTRKPTVMLVAHLDVAPAPDKAFSLETSEDKYLTHGVLGMKHAIACYMTIVDELKSSLDSYDFGIMITSDGKQSNNNGARMLVNELGYKPKVAIVPDGGYNWRLESLTKGVCWIKLESKGKRAHASRPWEGESAIHRLLHCLAEISDLFPKKPKKDDSLLSIGVINGGDAVNQISASASSMIDIRTNSLEDYKTLPKAIAKISRKHGIKATITLNDPPGIADRSNSFIKPMIEIVQAVTGKKHGTSLGYSATDGRIFSQAGIPAVVINPVMGSIHTDNEWLAREGLDQLKTALFAYLQRVALIPAKPIKSAPALRDESKYIWYANYGFGLWRALFHSLITGEGPTEPARHYKTRGCTDKSLPLKDEFLSLPYKLFFAGACQDHGGHGYLQVERDETAHTISRAYLITKEQFAQIISHENYLIKTAVLPFDQARQHGHATIPGGGEYDELLYCGEKDGYLMYSVTSLNTGEPNIASEAYIRMIGKGLSGYNQLEDSAIESYLAKKRITIKKS